jgi:hypothetical protein
MKGTGVHGMDTMGGTATTRLTGVPAVLGNATTPGSVLGEAVHQITQAESAQFAFTPSGGVSGFVPSGAVNISDPGHNHSIGFNNIAGYLNFGSFITASATNQNLANVSISIAGSGSNISASFSGNGITPTFSGNTIVIGSNAVHNNTQRVMVGTWYLRL